MPVYNFQKRFVTMIEDGKKRHTIRRIRQRPTKAGDLLKLYSGMRTKKCELILETVCTKVLPIQIVPGAGLILINGKVHEDKSIVRFASNDGFDNVDDFFVFFMRYSIWDLIHNLELIFWRFP